MSQRAVPPRPSTAGRQRSASTSRDACTLSTPRGTSSVPFPDGAAPGDASSPSAATMVLSGANSKSGERVHCGVQTETVEQRATSCRATEAEMREVHQRLLDNQSTSNALMSRAVAALEAKVQQAQAVSQALRLQESGAERIRVLEGETRELRAALAKKHEELVTVKRQLVQYHATYGPTFSTLKAGCRPPIVLDVSHLLAAAGAEVPGSSSVAAQGHQQRVSGIAVASEEGSGGGLTTQSLRHHISAEESAFRNISATSSLERMKREWKMQQQQQQHGLGAVRGMLSPDAVCMSVVAEPLTMTSIATAPHSVNGLPGQQLGEQALSWKAGGNSTAAGTSRAAAEAIAAQAEIIKSLEKENELLRQQRDATVRHNQQEHQRLMQELEEAHQSLDEQGASFSEKQKELQRLRTLMRFSQLKRDSDKLQETFQRLDDLENKLRGMHHQQHRHALDQDDLQRLRIIELQLCKVLRGELPWSSFPREMLLALPVPAATVVGAALASNFRTTTSANGGGSSAVYSSAGKLVPVATATTMVGSEPMEQRLVTLQSVTSKLPARPSTAKVSSASASSSSSAAVVTTAATVLSDIAANRSAQVSTSTGAVAGAREQCAVHPGHAPRQNAASTTPAAKQPSARDADEEYVYDDVDDDAEVQRGQSHAPHSGGESRSGDSRNRSSAAGGSDVLAPPSSKPVDRDLGEPSTVRDEDVSFSTITDRMKAYLERRARQQQDAAAQGLRAAEAAAAERKRQQQQAHAQAQDSRSSSMSLSNFGRRLDLLRQQSGSAGGDDTTSSGSTSAAAAAALSSRPLSAVRASSSATAAVAAAGGATPTLSYSMAAPVRPSTASNKRTTSLGRPAVKEPTEPPRQFAYIGGRMVPVR